MKDMLPEPLGALAALLRAAAAAVALASLSACVGTRSTAPMPNYQPEAFDGKSYVRHFAATAGHACEAARRALLSQGYLIDGKQSSGGHVLGRKHFQPSSEHHVQLEFNVVCADGAGSHAAGAAPASTTFVSVLKEQ